MRYIYENVYSNYDEQKGINISKYSEWMYFILRRSAEIGKVELPICSIILDERGTVSYTHLTLPTILLV